MRPRAALLTALILLAAAPGAARDGEPTGDLVLARWNLQAFTVHESGTCLWLRDEAGNLRLEIGASGTAANKARDLLGWRGDGWTLILASGAEATWNRWHERWEVPPADLQAGARQALDCPPPGLGEGPSGGHAPRPRFAAPGPEATRSWLIPRADGPVPFRRHMTERGAGRGAAEEKITARWTGSDCGERGSVLRLSSTRRPGRLVLEILSRLEPTAAPAEAFLPLWPLDRTLDAARISRELGSADGVSPSMRDPK